MKVLRPHQTAAIDMLRQSIITKHKRPMLRLATGSGKTLIATKIIANAVGKGKRVLFIVDAIELIDQTVQAFYDEGLHGIGVIQARHPMTDYSRPIQVASVQTLARRPAPAFDLAIVDEAHAQYETVRKLMADNPNTPFIGLSATPWSKGLGLMYDDLIQPVSMRELTDLGYVAKLLAYAPSHPDLSGVKLRAGEYRDDQLSKVMRGEKLIADVVATWRELGDNRPTFCFCVDRAHAAAMQERFINAGIGCGYIDGETSPLDRKAVRRQLDSGEIMIVCSVGTMIKGVDWKIGTIIDAQPTKSPMRHVQKLGRLRPFAEWEHALVLDHSDNILRLGLPIDIHRESLCTAKKGEAGEVEAQPAALPKGCPQCGAIKTPGVKKCGVCGFEVKISSDIEEGTGTLSLVGGEKKGPTKNEATPEQKERFFREVLGWAALNGKTPNQAAGKFKDKFGHWPAKKAGVQPTQPSPETLSWIKSVNIRYAKAMQRKRAA